ncbi:hypothetical protein CVT24_005278 [Panaeolus cyanescens]|uniref:Uncharacterized protein n=1 Tax=Panaeolus cyanescens TaxID=181874 RepID=A0A409Y934_9AGAR|nr:hypothetical protein CVT24_005278 [Panaeolus cyanescens]
MSLIDPICSTPSPDPPTRPDPTPTPPPPPPAPPPPPTPTTPTPTPTPPPSPPSQTSNSANPTSLTGSSRTVQSNSSVHSGDSLPPNTNSNSLTNDLTSPTTSPTHTGILSDIPGATHSATDPAGDNNAPESSPQRLAAGPLAGGIVTGVAVLAGLLGLFLWRRHVKRKTEDDEKDENKDSAFPSYRPYGPLVIPTPGLTPYAYTPPNHDAPVTESEPGTIEGNSSKSGLTSTSRKVVNVDNTIPLPDDEQADATPAVLQLPTEDVNPISSSSRSISLPVHGELLGAASSSSSPPPNWTNLRPLSAASEDLVVTGPELFPPPYHMIPVPGLFLSGSLSLHWHQLAPQLPKDGTVISNLRLNNVSQVFMRDID